MRDHNYRCLGCESEMFECHLWQNLKGCVAGLEFYKGHYFFFAIKEKTGKFIVPFYYSQSNSKEKNETSK